MAPTLRWASRLHNCHREGPGSWFITQVSLRQARLEPGYEPGMVRGFMVSSAGRSKHRDELWVATCRKGRAGHRGQCASRGVQSEAADVRPAVVGDIEKLV